MNVRNARQVLITGATGGVGQLAVAYALSQGYRVRALTRSRPKALAMFSEQVDIAVGDLRQPDTLPGALAEVDAVICCSGTTAFPSPKWQLDLPDSPVEQFLAWGRVFLDADYRQQQAKNSPAIADRQGVAHLIAACPPTLQRFVFVSSLGVERKQDLPFSLLNAYGVLDAKQAAETTLRQSGLPYTIVRPGRLIDGPYTSFDLNTLIKASTQGSQGVTLGQRDQLLGQTSRKDVAAVCVECLTNAHSLNQTFEIINEGSRPPQVDWQALLNSLTTQASTQS